MKKVIGLVLVFILVFTVASAAFAGSRPKIIKQPESATVNTGGKVTFTIKTSGTVASVTWYFVDPETGSKYSGKQIADAVKGVKVVGPTNDKKKITLNKVPETMHGWKVYAHVNGNGYSIDSDEALILIAGLDVPEVPEAESVETQPADNADSSPDNPVDTAPADQSSAIDESGNDIPQADPSDEPPSADGEASETDEGPETFTVTATSKVLRLLDDSGSIIDDNPSSKLEITGIGYVFVTSDDPIVSWTLNGIRIQPAEPVTGFRIMNIKSDLSIDIKTERASAADVVVDDSHMCKVVCRGCTFSYSRGKLRSVSEGEVPAGAPINVFADSSDLAKGGYSINGGEPENQGKAGFQLIVNEDVEIVCQ